MHGEFETRAPIIRQVIRELNGVPYLFAVYGCTPLVRFPLSALKDGAHVHGDVIGELGYGANPLDMLTFTSPADSKDYLLVTIDTRSASQIAVSELAAAPPQPTGGAIDFGPDQSRAYRDPESQMGRCDLAAPKNDLPPGPQYAGSAIFL